MINTNIEKSLGEINWNTLKQGRTYYPSPIAWEDEVLYFLFVDRFSNGKEFGGFNDIDGNPVQKSALRTTPLFNLQNDAWKADRETWFNAGKTWCGGHIKGIEDKLGYLKRMGITALWLNPIFEQLPQSGSYHGYGTFNFLNIDPRYGSREDLKELVEAAHDKGIRIILDIILNHAGDIFAYKGGDRYYYYQGQVWPVEGYRKDGGGYLDMASSHESEWPTSAVWPIEFQDQKIWTRKGEIRSWDAFPEYIEGDFCELKEIEHGSAIKDPAMAWDLKKRIDSFQGAPGFNYLCDIYKFWIGYADIDGYRIDTVKHMEPGAVRIFANVIHEYAQSLGKENFYLIGEVTGGRSNAFNIINYTGLDAALGINDIPDKLENLAKGKRSPGNPETLDQEGYFDLFRNSLQDDKNTHQWYAKHVVTMFDDHDQVGVDHKYRFCGDSMESYQLLRPALGLNLTSIGIPCLYYGTEQGFNGADQRKDDKNFSDVFLRECMFGGNFGSLQSTGKHFFNETHEIFAFIQRVCAIRGKKENIALRRGRQFLRQVSHTGVDFFYPQPINNELKWVVAWSRIFSEQEFVCGINTDPNKDISVWITIDSAIHEGNTALTCLYSTDAGQIGRQMPIHAKNGLAVHIKVPRAGFFILK